MVGLNLIKINIVLKPFLFSFIFLLITSIKTSYGQKINTNGGVLLKADITLGNQNQWIKIGLGGFGTLSLGDFSIESGFSLAATQLLKRHHINTKDRSFTYDVFGLIGGGQNNNLLGSSVSNQNHSIIVNPYGKNNFKGVGIGFEKELFNNDLKSYSIRRGKVIMRYSSSNYSIHMIFLNDFRFGALFNGEGTDYGETGTFIIGYTKVINTKEVYQAGVGLSLFTPQANYSLAPRNPVNSDDGRKNVWFVRDPYSRHFYSNIYLFGTYQNDIYTFHSKLGMNSEKLGAYIQNKLHDGFGLNPRFPWNIEAKDKLYYEIETALFYQTTGNND